MWSPLILKRNETSHRRRNDSEWRSGWTRNSIAFRQFSLSLKERGRKKRLYKQKRRRRQQAQHEISFVESKASEGQIPWQRRDTSETRNTSTIPLISVATVRHLVKRIEIFQEQIVSMCGRAEYGGGLGTAQSDAWNVIVGLTKNARTADKDVVTVRSLPLCLDHSIPLFSAIRDIREIRTLLRFTGRAVNTLTDCPS